MLVEFLGEEVHEQADAKTDGASEQKILTRMSAFASNKSSTIGLPFHGVTYFACSAGSTEVGLT